MSLGSASSNRGNGAARGGLRPTNATVDLDLVALQAHLDDPDRTPPPPLLGITPFPLGTLGGLPLGFTDATYVPARRGRLVVSMIAEDSPDATRDGRVAGSALGIVDEVDGRPIRLRWAPLRMADGTPFFGKVEGLAPDATTPGHVLLVVDADDPGRPSDLCLAELAGPW